MVNLDPFKVVLTDTSHASIVSEADSYPTINIGDTVKIEFRCLKDAMQVFVQGEFSFSTSQLHPDGKTPNPRSIKVTHYQAIQMITNTIRYGKLVVFRASFVLSFFSI